MGSPVRGLEATEQVQLHGACQLGRVPDGAGKTDQEAFALGDPDGLLCGGL